MNYSAYTAADFCKDEYFQRWVLSPDNETQSFWQSFQEQHPQAQGAIQEARQFLLVFQVREEDVLESKIVHLKRRIDLAIDQPDAPSVRPSEVNTSTPRGRMFTYAVAASVAFALACVSLWLWTQHDTTQRASLTQVVTEKGQRSLITLNDGTKVWLNTDSRLKYPKHFEGQPLREVFLEGEAFFDVAENAAQPFIVHAAEVNVRVLGTAFNVRSYGKDTRVETTLVRGKVNIAAAGQQSGEVTMQPNQRVVFEKASRKLLLENRVNTEKYTAWREGKLVFENQPFSEIVLALERWYNVTIEVQDSNSLGCRFSANVDNKSLPEVLELFKASENIDYRMEGDKVLIEGKLCAE
ncbi:FecR family protein [Chryseolinea lacunae]|uniref:FecR domain-containing protein n=1 Tax=Chryseolinea lacunae TaxID=2801331 RepID=A0ABS1KYU4_9BACT|nr:FecR family protein [Chryseolinea lacunae]MBL0744630.1 FecR domain-containing protein [Chryseolinea lacunae]